MSVPWGPSMGALMRSRTASDPHIFTPNDYNFVCRRCDRRFSDEIHWSREDDKAEMQRRYERAKAEYARMNGEDVPWGSA